MAFFGAKDIPGKNNFTPSTLLFLPVMEEIFCSDRVLFNGQPVGIIVAETFDIANQVVDLVKIVYEKTGLQIFSKCIFHNYHKSEITISFQFQFKKFC